MKKLLCVIVLIAGFVTFAFARPTLGVLPFTGGAAGEGEAIAGLFLGQHELRNSFTVVARNMAALNTIFTERRYQLSDLTDPNIIASLGRMFDATYILSGSITNLGDRNLLVASIIHVETFEQVAGYIVTYGDLGEVFGMMPAIATGLTSAAARPRPAGRQSLAVVPLTLIAGANVHDAETLAQILAIEVLNTGRYTVVPRLSIIQAALREQGFQMQGYTDGAGMASLGRALNADLVLGGSVTRLGATNLFMAQILNVVDGSVVGAESRQYQTIGEGADLMGELAIGMIFPPGAQRDEQLSRLLMRQGRAVPVPGDTIAAQLAWVRANAVSNGNYLIQVRGNETIAPQTLALPAGRSNVTFTLRGIGAMHTINPSGRGFLFAVASGVTLVLDENISLEGSGHSPSAGVLVNNGGILIMNPGAEITRQIGTIGTADYIGRGVVVQRGGTFFMNGGTIFNNARDGIRNGGTLTMNGGTISGHSSVFSAVFNHETATFSMHGGTISGNRTTSVISSGTFTMYGGVISDNGNGVLTSGTFTMHGGAISNNDGTFLSYGVSNSGTFVMHDGTISGNSRGVVLNGGSFRIINGIIYGNVRSSLEGSAVAQRGTINSAGVFSPAGALSATADHIRVVNGVLQ